MSFAAEHTSEHIFMRSLTNINRSVRVLKVEHKGDVNHIIIEADQVSWDDILRAAYKTNEVIRDNRSVYVEYFNSLEEAKEKYPDIRVYEERVKPPIRVVVIDGYDAAACLHQHVKSTGECILFLPIAFRSAKKGRYEIDFLAGFKAVEKAIKDQALLHRIMLALNSNYETLHERIQALINANRELFKKIKEVHRYVFSKVESIRGPYEFKVFEGASLDTEVLAEVIGEWIKEGGRVAAALNHVGEKCEFILASSEDVDIDLLEVCNRVLERYEGRGGGKRNWVRGYLARSGGALDYIKALLRIDNI